MLALAIRTDGPKAELYLYKAGQETTKDVWESGHKLSQQLNAHIDELVGSNYAQLQGIVVFEGPGSFTGLRIGFSVANALADSLEIPIIASGGKQWLQEGLKKLQTAGPGKIVLPKYGGEPNITTPKK